MSSPEGAKETMARGFWDSPPLPQRARQGWATRQPLTRVLVRGWASPPQNPAAKRRKNAAPRRKSWVPHGKMVERRRSERNSSKAGGPFFCPEFLLVLFVLRVPHPFAFCAKGGQHEPRFQKLKPPRYRSVIPTLAKNARVGHPQSW